jgi:hypothetical protein
MLSALNDTLIIINGPEDGTEFPLTRSPLQIGMDSSCVGNIRLDASVQPVHARVSAVSNGYRIRAIAGKTWVNGKRVGAVRSRILRKGDLLRVGQTSMCLECAPGGLASRSQGIQTESDYVWALRQGVSGLWALLRGSASTVGRIGDMRGAGNVVVRRLVRWIMMLVILYVAYRVLYQVCPPVRNLLDWGVYYIRYFLYSIIAMFSGGGGAPRQ